jgi:hypothetical protein
MIEKSIHLGGLQAPPTAASSVLEGGQVVEQDEVACG